MTENKFIDIDNVLKSKSKILYKFMPRFIINYLKSITHQDELNTFINAHKEYYDYEFVKKILEAFQIKTKITGSENLINSNRPIIASNHPLGGLDGVALLADISQNKSVKALGNDLLMHVENMKSLFLPVNKHGKNIKSYILALNEAFESEDVIIFFPAGLVSRKQKGIIKDLNWKKTFIQRAKKHKRDIIPTYIEGHNSHFFYNLANLRKFLGLKFNIEMLYLVDEMFKQKNKTISITYGKPIPYTALHNNISDEEWASHIKSFVYELKEDSTKSISFNTY